MKKRKILADAESKFIREAAGLLEKRSFETVMLPYERYSFCEATYENNAEAIIVKAENADIRLLELTAGRMYPKPMLFITAEKGDELPELGDSGAVVIRLPADPENTAELISLSIEKKRFEERRSSTQQLEDRITSMLMDGCITPERAGFHYLRDAIGIYIRKQGAPCNLRKELYSEISEKRHTTVNSIDRSIRTSIEKSWENSTLEFRRKYFGALGIYKIRKPSPKEFIVTLAERTIHEM